MLMECCFIIIKHCRRTLRCSAHGSYWSVTRRGPIRLAETAVLRVYVRDAVHMEEHRSGVRYIDFLGELRPAVTG